MSAGMGIQAHKYIPSQLWPITVASPGPIGTNRALQSGTGDAGGGGVDADHLAVHLHLLLVLLALQGWASVLLYSLSS
jgi:hypothetical protein